jgi:6-pyruvoyltetrahydropterin/6-carboxytetrahydropterin synthase
MSDNLYYLTSAPFEAARKVEILPVGHRARKLHGHSFVARMVTIASEDSPESVGRRSEEIEKLFGKTVAALDYSYLNDLLDVPTDENLARWTRDQLNLTGVSIMGIQSASDQGVDLDSNDSAHTWCKFRFEAAHQLPNVPPGHQCGRMHGHGFEVIIHAEEGLGKADLGIDFDLIRDCWTPIQAQLHNSCLNEIQGLENPTSEMLSAWIWERLKPVLKSLSWVTVYETITAGCHFDGSQYRIWKEFRFESALKFGDTAAGLSNQLFRGHSYVTRLHLTAPLDRVMGWTVDYGDVKELFKSTYKELDHHLLTDIDGVGSGDLESILRWMKSQMSESLPQLDRIDLYETPGRGAMLCWGEHGPALPV